MARRRSLSRRWWGVGYKTYRLHIYFVTGTNFWPVFVGVLVLLQAAIVLVGTAARVSYLDRRLWSAAAAAAPRGVLLRRCMAMPPAHYVVSSLIAATRDVGFGLAAAAAAIGPVANLGVVCSLALTSADPAWTSRAWNPGRSLQGAPERTLTHWQWQPRRAKAPPHLVKVIHAIFLLIFLLNPVVAMNVEVMMRLCVPTASVRQPAVKINMLSLLGPWLTWPTNAVTRLEHA